MFTNAAASPRATHAQLTDSPPLLVNLASGLFMLKGCLVAMAMTIAFIVDVFSGHALVGEWRELWLLVVAVLYVASQLWIGALLWRCSRLGGWLAVAFIAVPLAFGGLPSSTMGLVETVVSAALIASIWHHLE